MPAPFSTPQPNASMEGRLLRLLAAARDLPDATAIRIFVCQELAALPGVDAARFARPGERPEPEPVRRFPLKRSGSEPEELHLALADPAAFAPHAAAVGDCCAALAAILATHERPGTEPAAAADPTAALRNLTLTQILDTVPHAIFWKDVHGAYLGCNRMFARIAGLPHPAQIVGKTDFDMPWAQAEGAAYRADDQAIIAERQGRHIVEPQHQLDGTSLWIETTKVPLTDPAGGIYGVLGLFQDITERKRSEDALRQSELFLSRSQAVGRIGSYILDVRGAQTWLSTPVMDEILGLPPGYTKTGTTWLDLIVERDAVQHCMKEEVIARHRTFDMEYRIIRPCDGQQRWIHGRGELECDATGQPLHLIGTIQDITERKRVAEQLRQVADERSTVLDMITTGIAFLRNRKHVWVNPAFAKMFGYENVELQGLDSAAFYTDEADYRRVGAEGYAQVAAGGIYTTEVQLKRRDGTRLWCSLTGRAINPGDLAAGTIWALHDITALKESETAFRSLFTSSPVALCLLQGRKIQRINAQMCRVTGYSEAELIGQSTRLFYDDEAGFVAVGQTLYAQMEREGLGMIEAPLRRRDGVTLDTIISITPLDPADPAKGVVATILDLTQRKRAERQYRTILQTAIDGFWIVDTTGKIRDANEAICQLLGYTRDELLALSVPELEVNESAAEVAAHLARVAREGRGRFETRLRRHHQPPLEVEISITRLAGSDSFFVFIRDIAERKAAEREIHRLNTDLEQRVRDRTAELDRRIAEVEQLNTEQQTLMASLQASQAATDRAAAHLQQANDSLRLANQELEAFSYSVSHDLRAPLRNIAGFIELLRRRTAGHLDPEADRYFGIVGAESVRMGTLIDDLLTFSRIGRAELHVAPVSLATLVAETQDELHAELAGRAIHWQLQPLPLVQGDPTLLRQVVANLLANAVKFTRGRTPALIEIGAQPAPSGAEFHTFYVRDNGAGFDPKYSAKLFGVFQRLHASREFEGTGIGLANVKRIVERHGGRVWAEGTPAAGATFYFTLRAATS